MAHHFFLPQKASLHELVTIKGDDAFHAVHVLRLQKGNVITLADSEGRGYAATVIDITKDMMTVQVNEPLGSTEPRVKVSLYQGWPKGDKLDLIIEKCTELGVTCINVLSTERSIPQPGPSSVARRRERWKKKALAAARQSRRHIIPVVEGPYELPEALSQIKPGTLLLVPWEEEDSRSLKSVLLEAHKVSQIAILIGPEGGLSRAEVELAKGFGGIPVTLGPRILRTETAGLVCLVAIMYTLEELG